MSFDDQDPDTPGEGTDEPPAPSPEDAAKVQKELEARAEQKRRHGKKLATNDAVTANVASYHQAVVAPLVQELRALRIRMHRLEQAAKAHGW